MTAILRGDASNSSTGYGAFGEPASPSYEANPLLLLTLSTNAAHDGFVAVVGQNLGGLTQTAAGSEVFSGTAAQRVARLGQAAAGSEIFSGVATQHVGGLRQTATGGETFSGTATQRVAGLRQAAVGSEIFSGVATQRVGGLRQAAAGTFAIAGTIAQRVAGLRQSAVGSEIFSGVATQRVGGLRQTATGGETFSGTATQRVAGLRQAAVGSEIFSGVATQRVGGLRQAAAGTEVFSGTVAQRVAGLRQVAEGDIVFEGTVTQRVAGLCQAAVGDILFEGNAEQRLTGLRQSAIGDEVFLSEITQHLTGLQQTATGSITGGITPSFYMPMGGGGGIEARWDEVGIAWELSLGELSPEIDFNQFEHRILLEQDAIRNKESLKSVVEILTKKLDYEKVIATTLAIGGTAYGMWKIPAIVAPAIALYVIAASILRGNKDTMTAERKVVFETLLRYRDPIALRHMAEVFEKEGLIKEAKILNGRANIKDVPKDIRDARYAVYEKAMQSTNPDIVERVADAFESKFYIDIAGKLRAHAANLRKLHHD